VYGKWISASSNFMFEYRETKGRYLYAESNPCLSDDKNKVISFFSTEEKLNYFLYYRYINDIFISITDPNWKKQLPLLFNLSEKRLKSVSLYLRGQIEI